VWRQYACFNTILELSCPRAGDLLMFDKALYGRNDTLGSQRCRVPYDRKCQIDVQNLLNVHCGGKYRCSLAVNTAVFDDPCGYDEFLDVSYRCLPGTQTPQTQLKPNLRLIVSGQHLYVCNLAKSAHLHMGTARHS